MLIALTRGVSPSLGDCELQDLTRQQIDIPKAIEQHRNYRSCLADLGVQILEIPADPFCPDCVFVEDPVVVVDQAAVMTRMGVASRRGEGPAIEEALSRFRPVLRLTEPATLEGGDVMRIGKTLYVGLSRRTNEEGVSQLGELLGPFGYRVVPIPVHGCLHLKSACCYLGKQTILANREWIDASALGDFRIIDIPAEEPRGANVLRIGETLVLPASYPRTHKLLRRAGFQLRTVDVSEFEKAEGAVTCTSVLFDT
ncbi:MAG: arginine deiminase family protein [Bryobacteraceae bacterium]